MNKALKPNHPEDFGLFMQGTHQSVQSLGLLLRVRDSLCHRLHIRLTPAAMTLPTMALISVVPLVFNGALYPIGLGCGSAAFPILADFAVLTFFLFLFPLSSWNELAAISDEINDLLGSNEHRSELIIWWNTRLGFIPQLVFSLFGALGALTVTALVQPLAEKHVQFCVTSYVSTATVGGLGANSCYWLWMVPFLIRRISKFPNLNVRWHHPADTPALQGLSKVLIRSTWRTAIGILFTIMPVLYLYRVIVERGIIVVLFNAFIAAISLTTLFIVAAAPQRWLSKVADGYSDKMLGDIDIYISKTSQEKRFNDANVRKLESALAVYDSISNGKSTLIKPDVLTQYIAAGMTIIVPFAFQLVLHFIR